MARRKKKNILNIFLVILLVLLIVFLCYKIYVDNFNKNNTTNKQNEIKKENSKDTSEEKKEQLNKSKEEATNDINSSSNNVADKSSNDEETETKNEVIRKGGSVKLELIGDEEITISKGSKYKDAGVKATYSDGSDASIEVDVDNAVDTTKQGTYTVSYYAGNAIVIRRVTVK